MLLFYGNEDELDEGFMRVVKLTWMISFTMWICVEEQRCCELEEFLAR